MTATEADRPQIVSVRIDPISIHGEAIGHRCRVDKPNGRRLPPEELRNASRNRLDRGGLELDVTGLHTSVVRNGP